MHLLAHSPAIIIIVIIIIITITTIRLLSNYSALETAAKSIASG